MSMEDKRDQARNAFEVAKQKKQPEMLRADGLESKAKTPQPQLTPKGNLKARGDAEGLRAQLADKAHTFRAKVKEAQEKGRTSFSMREYLANKDRIKGFSRGDD